MQLRELIDYIARTPQSTIFWIALALTVFRIGFAPYLASVRPHLRTGGYKFVRGIGELFDSLVYAMILIFFVVRPFLFQTFVIPSGSMMSTLLINDYIGLNKAIYRYSEPKRFDIVVFRPPKRAVNADQIDAAGNINVDFIKRLIGLPGDTVEIRNDELYINGQKTPQPWVHYLDRNDVTGASEYNAEQRAALPRANFKLVQRDGKLIPVNFDEFGVNASGTVAKEFEPKSEADAEALRNAPPAKIPAGHYLFMGDNRLNSFDGRGWGIVPRKDLVGRAEFIWMPLSRTRLLPHGQ